MKEKLAQIQLLLALAKKMKLKYIIALVLFIIWMLFFDSHSYLEHKELNKEIEKLENNKAYYQGEIKHDNEKIKSYQNIEQIEKFAREKYYMKKDNEEIFIIEVKKDED